MRDLPLLLRHPAAQPKYARRALRLRRSRRFCAEAACGGLPCGRPPLANSPQTILTTGPPPSPQTSPPQKSRPHRDGFSSPYFAFPARMISRTVSSTTAAASRLMTAEATG